MGEGKDGWLGTGLGAKKGTDCRNYQRGRCVCPSPPVDCAGELAKKKREDILREKTLMIRGRWSARIELKMDKVVV